MGSGESIDVHDGDLAFAEIEVPAPPDGAFTVTWSPDGRKAAVAGPCPACGARTETDFSPVIGGTKGFFQLRRLVAVPALRSPLTLYCECGHVHADRPADAIDKGCGRFWTVSLADSERRPPGTGAP